MKRLTFLASMISLEVPKAQVPFGASRSCTGPAWPERKPVNNQCPVCGTMAEAYKRRRGTLMVPCDPPAPEGSFIACAAPGEPYGAKVNLVRCNRCNAAFWQDGV